ncbi:hypothetical protein BC834DRAFT_907660 [Gloeopeniophorella convolvens]|nr:hypothetical protein BC834DRAFT_907660 [Gloeopeniophorella convolvens]
MPIIMPPFIRSNSSPRMHAVYVQPPPASASTPTQVVYSGAPWNADGGGPVRREDVGERLQPTIDAAKAQLAKATRRAKIAGWILNTAIGLQVLIGALTTALGVALSGKNTSIPMAVLGGPEFSSLRAKALDHFVREAEAFKLDHGHEVGSEWDEKINDFRTDLEKILGKLLGNLSSTAAKGGVQPEDDSQKTGTQDPTMTVSLNGKYPVGTSATNTKLRLSLDNMPNGNQPGSVAIVAEAGTSPGDGNENTGSVDQTMTVSINGHVYSQFFLNINLLTGESDRRPVGNIPREKRTSSSGSQRVTQYTAQ